MASANPQVVSHNGQCKASTKERRQSGGSQNIQMTMSHKHQHTRTRKHTYTHTRTHTQTLFSLFLVSSSAFATSTAFVYASSFTPLQQAIIQFLEPNLTMLTMFVYIVFLIVCCLLAPDSTKTRYTHTHTHTHPLKSLHWHLFSHQSLNQICVSQINI